MRCAPFCPLAARTLAGLGLALLLAAVAGCGAKTGNVSGKVTYNGRPLPGAIIMFRPADPAQNSLTLALDADGRYSVTLPAGEVTVTVDTRNIVPKVSPKLVDVGPEAQAKEGREGAPGDPAKAQDAGRPAGKNMPIPERYASLETSGLKFTVKPGDQTYDVDLKD